MRCYLVTQIFARRGPLHYKKEAEKTVNQLIKKGVIVPANETTDWCSPAFFVPKGDKVRVRLLTDYTELNKHVKLPIHPFSRTKEILEAIPKEAKVFPKLDTVRNVFITPREVQISQSSNGVKCIIGRVVLPVRCTHTKRPMGEENCRQHTNMGGEHGANNP